MTTEECFVRIERNLAETGEILHRIDIMAAQSKERAAQSKERAAQPADTHNSLGEILEILDSLERRQPV